MTASDKLPATSDQTIATGPPRSATVFTWWCASTVFVGAFLLFQVQPVISKMILPWFGGGPAVWTTCMLFFQVVLLAGYAYAHFLASRRSAWRPLCLHLGLLLAATLLLPINPAASWKPSDGLRPTTRILALLAAHVGLPYFVLSTTGPLVQAWFHRVQPSRSPYRLFALSNAGSLGALLTYPFLFEPMMTTGVQGILWSCLFGLFALLCGALAWRTYTATDNRLRDATTSAGPATVDHQRGPTAVGLERRVAWLVLPAMASMMLLAVTNHVSQDIAVVPFLWVVPLSLYLLSFILTFESDRWYRRRILPMLTILALFALSVVLLDRDFERLLAKVGVDVDLSLSLGNLVIEATIYQLVLFLVCMLCHGEVARLKPAPAHLTSFYLMISAGGALGGIFVALICPQLFSAFVELNLGLVGGFMLAMGILWDDLWNTWLLRHSWSKCVAFAVGFALLFVVVRAQFKSFSVNAVVTKRNFYGVLSVKEYYTDDPEWHLLELLNGRILHGSQFMDPDKRRMPTTYYNPESGIGITLQQLGREKPLRVAVVGLGTGTIATYGKVGDYYCFYELNAHVRQLASTYFSYLDDTAADVQIQMGDARLSMERQLPQAYDVMVLDAFSGDAIPAHLLTREAFSGYLRHLKPDGVIAVHISNRHLDLSGVIGGLAEFYGRQLIRIEYSDGDAIGQASSDWLMMTRNQRFLFNPVVREYSRDVEYAPVRLWTDQYSNLFQILD